MRNSEHLLLSELLASISMPTSNGVALARTLEHIARHEIEEGGPYAATAGGSDADLGLNLAIAVFLGQNGVRLEKLDAYVDRCIAEGVSSSDFLDERELARLMRHDGKLRNAVSGTERKVRYSATEKKVLDAVRRALKKRLKDFPRGFTENAQAVVERTIRRNTDKQMSLMPLYVREALGKKGKHFSDESLAELGLANVFFWTAFIIYDDFWDEDEAAEPKLLPIANMFARHYVCFFETMSGFGGFFHKLMDLLDAANEWEMLWCRLHCEGSRIFIPDELPDYGDFMIKFHPAAGHVLGPVSMFGEFGYGPDSAESSALIEYFRQYLVSMQLNDDAHDWKEDLRRGHISTAIALLLQAWKEEHPERGEVDLEEDMPELERLFWFRVLEPLCESVLACTERSRAALHSLHFLENIVPLERFITENERIAREALEEQKRSVEFLEALA